jgi:hypothetical protein
LGATSVTGSQDTVSNALFHDWYVSEMVDPADATTAEWLSGTSWKRGARGAALNVASADEMLFDHLQRSACRPRPMDPRQYRFGWNGSSYTWERVQMREDGEGFGNRA